MRVSLLLMALAAMLLLAGCDRSPSEQQQFQGVSMGTTWRLRLRAPESEASVSLGGEVQALLDAWEAECSHWDPASPIGRFNEAARLAPHAMALPPCCIDLIRRSLELRDLTGGAFDITKGSEVAARGLGAPALIRTPSEDVGNLLLDGEIVSSRQPGTTLDLSAIAKGAGVDAVATFLLAQNHQNFVIEIGGEIRAHGTAEDGRPWTLGIQVPQPGPIQIHTILPCPAEGMALATSGNYQLFKTNPARPGEVLSHLITEEPETTFRSVSVVHASAREADAWATALFVLPVKEAERLARSQGIHSLFLTLTPEGTVRRTALPEQSWPPPHRSNQ